MEKVPEDVVVISRMKVSGAVDDVRRMVAPATGVAPLETVPETEPRDCSAMFVAWPLAPEFTVERNCRNAGLSVNNEPDWLGSTVKEYCPSESVVVVRTRPATSRNPTRMPSTGVPDRVTTPESATDD